jgi:demethylmenaquinone methyltransferase/2-methoxy-6-polyprenyl-1,4-benzoquinol methylase
MVICEFSHPTNPIWNALYQKTLSSWLPKLAGANGSDENAYRYLVESIEGWYDQPSLAKIIRETGWQSVDWRNLSGGALAIHRATK